MKLGSFARAAAHGSHAQALRTTRVSLANIFDVLVIAIPLAVYVASLSPNPDAWDYGEYEVVPYILGIPHATGFPVFVMLGWVFSHAFLIGTIALRMKLFSALFIVGSAYLIRRLALAFGAHDVTAFLAALVFSFTQFAWTKASHADVHSMSLFCSLLVFFFVLDFAKSDDVRSLCFAALAFGIGLAVHPNVLWSGVALVPGFARLARRDLRRAAFIALVAFAPLALYLYLPIRSQIVEMTGVDPAQAAPISFHGEIAWNNNRPDTWDGFWTEVSGSQFSALSTLGAVFSFSKYPQFATTWLAGVSAEISVVALVLALFGALAIPRLDPQLRGPAVAILCASFAAIPFTFSYGAELDLTRYVSASLAVALAFAAAASRAVIVRRDIATVVVALLLAWTAWSTFAKNHYLFNGRVDTDNRPTVDAVARYAPPGAIVLASWLDATSLAYGAYADGSLAGRVPLQWMGTDVARYPEWAKTRRVFALSDFVIKNEIASHVPAACLHSVATFESRTLFEIRC